MSLRDWTSPDYYSYISSRQKKKPTSAAPKLKTSLCFYYVYHPDGCPLSASNCRFAHGTEDLRNSSQSTHSSNKWSLTCSLHTAGTWHRCSQDFLWRGALFSSKKLTNLIFLIAALNTQAKTAKMTHQMLQISPAHQKCALKFDFSLCLGRCSQWRH